MKWRRTFLRSFFYYEKGYNLLSKPIQLISFSTTFYYLAIMNIPALKALFPTFKYFLFSWAGLILPFAIYLGWFWVKRLLFYKQTFEINQEVNPYTTEKISKNQIPIMKCYIEFFGRQGIDTSELTKLVEKST